MSPRAKSQVIARTLAYRRRSLERAPIGRAGLSDRVDHPAHGGYANGPLRPRLRPIGGASWRQNLQ